MVDTEFSITFQLVFYTATCAVNIFSQFVRPDRNASVGQYLGPSSSVIERYHLMLDIQVQVQFLSEFSSFIYGKYSLMETDSFIVLSYMCSKSVHKFVVMSIETLRCSISILRWTYFWALTASQHSVSSRNTAHRSHLRSSRASVMILVTKHSRLFCSSKILLARFNSI